MKLGLNIHLQVRDLKISVNLLIFVFIIVALILKIIQVYLLTLIFIVTHEAGHVIASVLCSARVYSIRILPVGMNASLEMAVCNRMQRIFIYVSGPAVSLLLAALCQLLTIFFCEQREFVSGAYINLWLAIFNLLPIIPLDGGKIAIEILANKLGLKRAGKLLRVFSIILSILIILLGICIFINSHFNISLFIIGIYILICLKGNKEETAFMNIKSFLFRRSRIIKKGIYPVREIVVLKGVKISDVIKTFDYMDSFHIINVLDENFRIVMVLTEQQVLDAVIKYSTDTTFDNLVQIEYNVHNEVN